MKLNILLLAITSSILLFSCRKENSEKVSQDEIWTDYRVVYRSDLDSTYARVMFKHMNSSGEALKLSSKSSISIAGTEPDFNNIYYWYELKFGELESSVNFNYEDLNGDVFENTVSILSTTEVLSNTDTLYKDSIYRISWDGGALASGEIMNIVLDGAGAEDLTVVSQDTIGATSVFIADTSFNKLPLGDLSLHFERWSKASVEGTSAGSQGYGHYISKKVEAKMVNP